MATEEPDLLWAVMRPDAKTRAIVRRAAQLKDREPNTWAAIARDVFDLKTAKGAALLMPEAIAIQVAVVGVKKAGKHQIDKEGRYWL